MSEYRAPLDEYRFLLRHVIDAATVLRQASEGDLSLEDADSVMDAAAQLAEQVLAPLNVKGDQQGPTIADGQVKSTPGFRAAMKAFVEGGWTALSHSTAVGGQGIPHVVGNAVLEFWSGANPAFAIAPGLTISAAHTLDSTASPEQKDRYLPKLVAGQWTGTMNLTEPQAGTDVGSIRTKAVRQPDGTWRISGQKIFISWGEHDLSENIIHLVLARAPDAPEGPKGISLFIVPKFLVNDDGSLGPRNAVTCTALERKLGIHASPTCVMQYEEATGFLVGAENRGLTQMFVMMNEARMGTGSQALGISECAYQKAEAYSRERIQSKAVGVRSGPAIPIAGHPDIQRILLNMRSLLTAMRGVNLQVGAWMDLTKIDPDGDARKGWTQRMEFLVPIMKAWLTECAQDITYDAIQVHGGMGFVEDTGVAQQYRDARITTIYEGTTAIQANDLIGRKLTSDGAQTARSVLAGVRDQVVAVKALGTPRAQRFARRLGAACDALEQATDWMLEAQGSRSAHAGAVPFITMWGLVLGASVHARCLLAASGSSMQGFRPEFIERKIRDAVFFADYHLPHVEALKTFVTEGTEEFAVTEGANAEQV